MKKEEFLENMSKDIRVKKIWYSRGHYNIHLNENWYTWNNISFVSVSLWCFTTIKKVTDFIESSMLIECDIESYTEVYKKIESYKDKIWFANNEIKNCKRKITECDEKILSIGYLVSELEDELKNMNK